MQDTEMESGLDLEPGSADPHKQRFYESSQQQRLYHFAAPFCGATKTTTNANPSETMTTMPVTTIKAVPPWLQILFNTTSLAELRPGAELTGGFNVHVARIFSRCENW